MGGAEERLVLLDRIALVVENRAPAPDPASVRVPELQGPVSLVNESTVSAAHRRKPGLGLHLLHHLTTEAVGVAVGLLKARIFCTMLFARQRVRRHGLPFEAIAVEVVLEPHRRIVERVAFLPVCLPHHGDARDHAECVEGGGGAVLVWIRDELRTENTVVVFDADPISEWVRRPEHQERVRVVLHLVSSTEGIDGSHGQVETVGIVDDTPRRSPPGALLFDVVSLAPEQRLGHLPVEHVRDEPGSERLPVGLEGERQGLDGAEGKRTREVVLLIDGARTLDEAALDLRPVSRDLVGDLFSGPNRSLHRLERDGAIGRFGDHAGHLVSRLLDGNRDPVPIGLVRTAHEATPGPSDPWLSLLGVRRAPPRVDDAGGLENVSKVVHRER